MFQGLSFKSTSLLGYIMVAPSLPNVFGNLLSMISLLDMLCFTKHHKLGSCQLSTDLMSPLCIKILSMDF